jgi:hypothetical protein
MRTKPTLVITRAELSRRAPSRRFLAKKRARAGGRSSLGLSLTHRIDLALLDTVEPLFDWLL